MQMLFLRALLAMPLVSLSLKWRGFDKTRTALRKTLPRAADSPMDLDFARRRIALTARMINSADRHGLTHFSCLTKSLTLWWLLGRQGIVSQLKIGVRKENSKFEAHAWVERDGLALNEPEEQHHHYAAFDAAFTAWPENDA